MLSRRLRRRLRQIDEGPAAEDEAAEHDSAAEPAELPADAEAAGCDDHVGSVRAGAQGLSRGRPGGRAEESAESPGDDGASRPGEMPVAHGPLAELAPGEALQVEHGSLWLVRGPAAGMLPHGERILTQFARLAGGSGAEDEGALGHLRGIAPSQLALLDMETGGLSAAPVFLVGMILWEADAAEEALCVQMLARDYAEERAVLGEAARLLAQRRVLMTYNGRSFDIPMMRERMIYHDLGQCPEPPAHVDLLHAVRARFRDAWENCRLQTLEERLCGRSRLGDIDGADIPDAWHEFVHTGDAGRIAQVLEHNRLDLITMLEVLPHLLDPED